MTAGGGNADLPRLRSFAHHLADAADAIALEHFGGPVPAVAKPDGSPVTAADRAIEAVVRAAISATYPDHAVLGEEQGGAIDPSTPTWVIDPIDATKNFMRGLPIFASLIGLVVDGAAVVGVASAPAMGERWDAARGLGATRNGTPVQVSGVRTVADAHVLHGGLDWWRTEPRLWGVLGRLADAAWRTRGFGDYWMHLLVAGGMADAAVEQDLKPWDVVALQCIISEAGGRVTSWRGGSPLEDGSVVSSNGLVHDELLALLRG